MTGHVEAGLAVEIQGQRFQLNDAGIGGLLELEDHVGASRCRPARWQADAAIPAGVRDRQQQLGNGPADAGRWSERLDDGLGALVQPGEKFLQGEADALADGKQLCGPGRVVPTAGGVVVGEHVQVADAAMAGDQQDLPVGIETRVRMNTLALEIAQNQTALETALALGRNVRLQLREQIEAGRALPDQGVFPYQRRGVEHAETGQAGGQVVAVVGEPAFPIGDEKTPHAPWHAAQARPDHRFAISRHRPPPRTDRGS